MTRPINHAEIVSAAAEPQRIAFFVRALDGGGAQRDAVLLANEIALRGHAVKLLTLKAEGPLRALVGAGVDIVALRGQHLRVAVPSLRRAIVEHRPHVLVSAEAASNLAALAATRLLSRAVRPRLVLREAACPSIAERRDPYVSNRLAYRALRLAYRYADVVVTLTDGAARDLAENFGVPRAKLAVLRSNAVIDAAAALAIGSGDGAREPGLVVSVGRLSPEKDHATLIQAFARLDPDLAKRLEIAGDGPLRPQLTALIAELGLGDRVVLTGFAADPFLVFRRAQVAVCSSLYEGFGNAIVEALACGTPVASTDCPFGPGEILAGGRYGRLAKVGDADDLARAITQALADEPDRAALRARAAVHTSARAAEAFLAILAQSDSAAPRPTAPAAFKSCGRIAATSLGPTEV